MTVGRVYSTTMNHPSGITEVLLEKTQRERDEWKAKFIQANKDYGFELSDPCGTIWDHAKRLQAERDEARAELYQARQLLLASKNALRELRRWVADGDCSADHDIWTGLAGTAYQDAVRNADKALAANEEAAK